MTLREGLRLYPKAIAWSVLISSICAMEGYDVALIGNFCMSRWTTEAERSSHSHVQTRLHLSTRSTASSSRTGHTKSLRDGRLDSPTGHSAVRSWD
jgi:hypothetical protein